MISIVLAYFSFQTFVFVVLSIKQLAVSLSVYTTLFGLFRLWLRGIEAALLCGSDVLFCFFIIFDYAKKKLLDI